MRNTITYDADADFKCLMLGKFGFSSRGIGSRTGLSMGQVNYRLKQLGIKRKPYRDGDSEEAQKVIAAVAPSVEEALRRDVAAFFKKKRAEAAKKKKQ